MKDYTPNESYILNIGEPSVSSCNKLKFAIL